MTAGVRVGKSGTGWLPENDFVELRAAAEQVEPFAIGDTDKGLHCVKPTGWIGA